jgi:hypothetical protein
MTEEVPPLLRPYQWPCYLPRRSVHTTCNASLLFISFVLALMLTLGYDLDSLTTIVSG